MKVKSLVIFAIFLSLVLYSCAPKAIEPANNQIWYQTTSGKPVELAERTIILNGITSNKRCRDWCVIEFDHPINEVPFGMFKGCGLHGCSDAKKVPALTRVWLPKNTTYINQSAFANCNRLKYIIMPDSLECILPGAFAGCESIDSISLPKHLITLGEEVGGASVGVFEGCSHLRYIELPSTLQSLGSNTFKNCCSLTSFDLPEHVWYGDGFFEGCTKLHDVHLPSDAVITDRMFYGCTSLESIKLPSDIKYIGRESFCGCTKIADVNIPSKVEFIGGGAFDETNLSWLDGYADEELIRGLFKQHVGDNFNVAVFLMGYSPQDTNGEEIKDDDFIYDELLLLMPLYSNGKFIYTKGRAFVLQTTRAENVLYLNPTDRRDERKIYDFSIIGESLILTHGYNVRAKNIQGTNKAWDTKGIDEEDRRRDKRTVPYSCTMYIANNGKYLYGAPGGFLSKVKMQIDGTKEQPDPTKRYILVSHYDPLDRIDLAYCNMLINRANTNPTKSARVCYEEYEDRSTAFARSLQNEIEHPSMATQIRFEILQRQMREAIAYQQYYDQLTSR